MVVMKMNDHFLGDRVSVRCARGGRTPRANANAKERDQERKDAVWLGGQIIARDESPSGRGRGATRYVIQLDDHRRVVAFDEDVRRFTFAFEVVEMLERMAS